MKRELSDRFDMIMANLKPIEPSTAFDFELKQMLNEISVRRLEETAFDRLARRAGAALESLRYALMPPSPVLVKMAATFVIVISVGFYTYSIQPVGPVFTSEEGVVMVRSAGDSDWRRVESPYRFKIGDMISTNAGSQIDMERYDRFAVRLKENTKVRIAGLPPRIGNGKVILELVEGKALLNISERFKGSRFIVNTGEASALALGTKFEVDVSKKDKPVTKVSVLEGKVRVESRFTPEKPSLLSRIVTVLAGQKTEVFMGQIPAAPQRLMEAEWLELDELYQVGRKPQVMLLLRNTSDRARQLLRPCPIYIKDEKPREIPTLLEDAIKKTADAVKSGDAARHLESIKLLERLVNEHPNPKYDPQLLLYIGAYYEYLSDHREAIRSFEKVLARYPHSSFASIAQCAIGIVYEERLNDPDRAAAVYRLILKNYPDSLEAIWAERRLGIKKSGVI